MNFWRQRTRRFSILLFSLISLFAPLTVNHVQAATTDVRQNSIDGANLSLIQSSANINSILRDVVKQMEPALTDFMTTYSFDRVSRTQSNLEAKYRANSLSIDWDVSSDAKLFVVIKVSGKQYCYTNTGAYSIKLKKSTRCR